MSVRFRVLILYMAVFTVTAILAFTVLRNNQRRSITRSEFEAFLKANPQLRAP